MKQNVNSIVAPDFSDQPYWWRSAAPEEMPSTPLSPRYDVIVVGSGITGLRAAIDLARAGAKVVVFEKDRIGSGASRRNAGFLGRVLKKSFRDIEKKDGHPKAMAIYSELNRAFRSVGEFVQKEGIQCHLTECGRFIAATSPAHQAVLVAEMESLRKNLGLPFEIVAPADVRTEMGADIYHGGIVVPDLASLHPGLYHKGLTELALAAGVTMVTSCAIHSVDRLQDGTKFSVATDRGRFGAENVIVATNGYTPQHLKWHARRLIPFDGFMAATEEISQELLDEVIPHGRTIIDSNTNIDFFRPAPDSRRLMFGGATGSPQAPPEVLAERMHRLLVRVFPQMAEVKLSNVWTGKCAGTFDMMPHMGNHDGLWHGMGYNFAGVPMGTYFGQKIAEQILQPASERSVFMSSSLSTLPFYQGNPWFVPLVMKFFEWQDRRLAGPRV
jgi:glycine/D-amino acid oxidase-like deaminating enzyme